jgi:2-hydroxychromene-2-carboxylate isomerase
MYIQVQDGWSKRGLAHIKEYDDTWHESQKTSLTEIFSSKYGMSFKSPLAKLPARRGRAEAHQPIVPETLVLPDGRTVPVKDITKKISNRANHNLRLKRTIKIPDIKTKKRTQPPKYTVEERVWQSTATVDAIMQRYGYTQKKALGVMYNSRYIVGKLGLDTDTRDK